MLDYSTFAPLSFFLPVSLFFPSHTRPVFSRMVPLWKTAHTQSFSLSVSFFLATVLILGFRLWFSTSVKHLETILIVKGAIQIKRNYSAFKWKRSKILHCNVQEIAYKNAKLHSSATVALWSRENCISAAWYISSTMLILWATAWVNHTSVSNLSILLNFPTLLLSSSVLQCSVLLETGRRSLF